MGFGVRRHGAGGEDPSQALGHDDLRGQLGLEDETPPHGMVDVAALEVEE